MTVKSEVPDGNAGAYVMPLVRAAALVEPARALNIVKADPSDDRILEAAVAGKADRTVTGDRHLLDLKECGEIRMRRAADL